MTRSARGASTLIGVVPIALVIGIWQAVAASGLAPPSLLPPPAAVFAMDQRLREETTKIPAYWRHSIEFAS